VDNVSIFVFKAWYLNYLMKASKLLTLLTLLFLSIGGFGQNEFKSEDELKERANELFEERKFEEASPLLAQLLSLYPQDPNYNFKYAATLLSISADRDKPLKYLKFAISKSSQVDPLAYYFLGNAYHLNYNFSDAVKYYTRFKQKGDSKTAEEFAVDRQIQMAKNGQNMLGRMNEVQVIEKQVVPRKDFFRVYELEGIDGKIIAKPEDFRSKYDEKVGERSVIYLPNNAIEVYYSSYGKKGDQGKDIFKAVKLGSNSWSDPVRLGSSINTPYDEDFPFIHPDGRTLFFASKGHSSMGGYDLFKSTYDQSTAEWTEPENMDFAFSTVDDDILFVTDQDQTLAYFASDRANPAGEVTVYKVLVDKAPAKLSVIKGKLIAENDPELKKARITVIDEATQQTVGIYETDDNGNYQVEIANNGGNYRFNVETTEDAPLHTGAVEIPRQDEFTVLGQELRLVGSGDEQQLVIKNIFDGSAYANNSGPNISSETLKMKAMLDVNLDDDQLAAIQDNKPSESNSSNPSSADRAARSKEELAEIRATLTSKSAALNDGSLKAYKSAAQLKAEADKAFAEAGVDPKKAAVGAELSSNQELKNAQELASRAAIMTALAQKMEKESEQAEKLATEVEAKSTEIQSQLDKQEYDQAESSIDKFQRESGRIPDSKEYLSQYDRQLIATMEREGQALKAEEARLASLKEDDKRMGKEISELESGTSLSEEEQQKLNDLKTDRDDIQFQMKSTQLDVDLKQTELAALSLEKGEVENLMNDSETRMTVEALPSSEKQEVVDDLKTYRDNRQLAYLSPKSTDQDLSVPSEEYINEEISSPEVADIDLEGVRSTSALKKDFEDRLASTAAMDSETQATQKRVEIYEDWIQELDKQEKIRRDVLATADSEVLKSQLEDEINQISREKSEVIAAKTDVDSQITQAEDNQITEAIDDPQEKELNPEDVIVGDDEQTDLPEGYVEVDVAKVDENTPYPSGLQTFDFDKKYEYTSQNAKAPLKAAKVALYQAKKYDVSADEARRSAYVLPTPEERRQAFKDVNKFEKAALLRELEAMKAFGNVNQQEFYRNSSILNNLNDYDQEETESTNLDLANLLQDEADTYFIQAEEMRTEAEADGLTNISQKNKLQKAYDLEMLALSKQRQALESLKLVDAEVEGGSMVEDLSTRNFRNAQVQTITNPEVLAISNSKEAKVIGDELNQKADSLIAEADRLTKSADVVSVGPERDSLLLLAEKKEDSASQVRSEASVYYKRQSQLENGFVADASIDEGINRPPKKYTESEYELDNVEIDEERKPIVTGKVEYDEFLVAAKANHQQVKAAEIEYQKAVELRKKQLELDVQSQTLLQSAAQVDEPAEKERRVKEARIIELKAQQLEKSIDSLNKIIKIKNFLVSTSEREMRKSVEGLSPEEQSEIAYFASRQIDKEEAEGGVDVSKPLVDTNIELETEEDPAELSEKGNAELSEGEIDVTAATDEVSAVLPNDQTAENPQQKDVSTEEIATQVPSAINRGSDNTNEKQEASEEVTETPVNRPNTSNTPKRSTADIDEVPAELNQPVFQLIGSGNAAYSEANPIPNMNGLPDGIVYKVQVGAFRNPVSQDLFKGFAPIMAESANSGITRYSAGMFDNEIAAIRARDQIRQLGYQDAFVVVFRDGKRTSISSARGDEGQTTSSASGSNRQAGYQFQTGVQNIEQIGDLFFSVQIGVFSKEVEDGSLDSFREVNALKLPSGLIRYNAGIFEDLESAQAYKNQLTSKVPDAFIVAYYQGRRVSINEAARILNQNQ